MYLAIINKDPNVSVIQANVNFVQKRIVLDLESEVMRGLGSIPNGG